jgi:2'-5' RNA ligase
MQQFTNLYFIALIPPESICNDITSFKNDIARYYNSLKALRSVPHITLKAPFTIDTNLHNQVVDWFTSIQLNQAQFDLQLNSFGVFDNPKNPVLYVKPILSDALLTLQQTIIAEFERAFNFIPIHYLERDFNPHITIGYRDLSYPEFEKAWQIYQYKKYDAAFSVKNICLLKHDGAKWNVIAKSNLE